MTCCLTLEFLSLVGGFINLELRFLRLGGKGWSHSAMWDVTACLFSRLSQLPAMVSSLKSLNLNLWETFSVFLLISGPLDHLPVLLTRTQDVSQNLGKLALQSGCGKILKSAFWSGGPSLRLRGAAGRSDLRKTMWGDMWSFSVEAWKRKACSWCFGWTIPMRGPLREMGTGQAPLRSLFLESTMKSTL